MVTAAEFAACRTISTDDALCVVSTTDGEIQRLAGWLASHLASRFLASPRQIIALDFASYRSMAMIKGSISAG
jgi:hypothetical protein